MLEFLDVRVISMLVGLSWFVIGQKFRLYGQNLESLKSSTDAKFTLSEEKSLRQEETNKRYVLETVSDCRSELYKGLNASEEVLLRQIEKNRDAIENVKTAQSLLTQDYERTKLDLSKLDKTVNEIQKELHEVSKVASEILMELRNIKQKGKPNETDT